MDKDMLEMIKNEFSNIEDYLTRLEDSREEILNEVKEMGILFNMDHG